MTLAIDLLRLIMQNETPLKRSTLNLRIKPEEKQLIDRAAEVLGKNRTDFVIDAARRVAEETLSDLRIINVDAQSYEKFLALLDMPSETNESLMKTMQSKAPWEK